MHEAQEIISCWSLSYAESFTPITTVRSAFLPAQRSRVCDVVDGDHVEFVYLRAAPDKRAPDPAEPVDADAGGHCYLLLTLALDSGLGRHAARAHMQTLLVRELLAGGHHHDRAVSVMHDLVADGADHERGESATSSAPDNEQVGAF